MDVKGAKALKERLGLSGADEAPPAPVDADVPEDAPPVEEDDPGSPGASLLRRLGLSFR